MRALFLASTALLVSSVPMFGWGCEGHQIVALIARAHLTPAAAAAVDKLLMDNPTDPALRAFCRDKTGDPMADTASWADDVKSSLKTGVWHYLNIPLTESGGGSLAAWCPPIGPSVDGKDRPGCIATAIEYEWSILLDTSQPGPDRATALRYLIHFIGDMHQPLHTSNNDDEGGNCTVIRFFADERPTNLHSIWDTKMIQHEMTGKNEKPVDYARVLDQKFAQRWPSWGTAVVDPGGWIWELNAIVRNVTYGDLKPSIPVEQPDPKADCKVEKDKVAALHITVDESYFNDSIPVVGEQLAKAGYRLADLLNRTF